MHTATVIYFAIQNLQNLAHVTQSHRLAQPPLGRLFTRTQRLRSPHVVTESDEEGDDLPIGLSSPAMQGRDNDFSPTSDSDASGGCSVETWWSFCRRRVHECTVALSISL